MLRLRVMTEGTDYLASGPPEPALDHDSKQPKTNKSGEALYVVPMVAMSPDGAEVLRIKVSGEPKGIVRQTPLKLTGLIATYWELNGHSGVSFSAERIEPLSARAAS